MRPNKKTSQFLIIAAGTLLLAMIGYLLYQNSQLRQQLTPKEPPSIIPLNTEPTPSSETNKDNSESKAPTKQVTHLTYSLPSDWKTVQDKTGTIEVGYNPQLSTPNPNASDLSLDISKNGFQGQRINVNVDTYDGGSRHRFLYKRLGLTTISSQDKLDTYHEKEYIYNGWSCLVLYGVSISQIPVNHGMCAINSSQALAIYADVAETDMEKIIQTIRLLK